MAVFPSHKLCQHGAMRTLFVVLFMTVLAAPASAQDFKAGLDAYDRGDFAAALKEWRPLAELGDARAQFNLGVILFNGQGVPHDPAKAVEWYRAAADQGYGPAQANLSFMYETGQGLLQNYIEAYKWSTLAVSHGVETRKRLDSLAAKMTAEQIADADRAVAAWQPRSSGTALSPGVGDVEDAEGETDTPAAVRGRSRKQIREVQGQLNSLGFEVGPADGVAGKRTRAAIREFQDQNGLSVTGAIDEDLITQLAAGIPNDRPALREPEVAARVPEEARASTPPVATSSASPDQALDCDRLAAHPADARLPAGIKGVSFGDIDAERAIEACEAALALNAGDMRYQLQLARSLHKGERLEEAVVHYQQAGLQGHALAQKTLGFIYANGLGVTRDYAKTAQWHHMAADQGDSDAQQNLGYLYAAGQGVSQDIIEAHKWYNIAAGHGIVSAAANRDVLAATMTDEQITEAERRALAWFDIHPEAAGSQ